MIKSTGKKLLNQLVNIFMEEEEEIIDSGLDDVDIDLNRKKQENVLGEYESTESDEDIEEKVEFKESKQKVKKQPFVKQKQKTLEEDLFKQDEPNIMDEMKSIPFQSVEIIEMDVQSSTAKNEPGDGYKKVASVSENVTEELTEEQKEAEEFYARLDASEEVINQLRKVSLFQEIEQEVFGGGFEDTFFSLMEAIKESQVLERDEKTQKMNSFLSKLISIDTSKDMEVYDYFMVIRHELHKAVNSLGEYSSVVNGDRSLKTDMILNYEISKIYQNGEHINLLLESDVEKYVELQELTREMYLELKGSKYVSEEKRKRMQDEYGNMFLESNTLCEILKNIELVKSDLYKIRNGLDEFSMTSLALD